MDVPYVEPSYKQNEFNCPYCSVRLHQTWYRVMHDSGDDVHRLPYYEKESDSQAGSRMGVVLLAMGDSCEPEAHIASQSDYVRFVKMLHLVNVITVGNMLFGLEINWFIQLSR